jgi:hypothetical protein
MKTFSLFLFSCALCILLASCPTSTGPVEGMLKGAVYDRYSGLPASGITVSFGRKPECDYK